MEVQPGCKPRPYVLYGGPCARAGFQFRWELLHSQHTNQNHSSDRRSLPHLKESFLRGPLPTSTATLRAKTVRAVAGEISGMKVIPRQIPTWLQERVERAVLTLSWPRQSTGTLRDLLRIIERVLHWARRAADLIDNQTGDSQATVPMYPPGISGHPTPAQAG